MNFQIQNALGGKFIGSRSELTRLRNVMSLLPNTKFEVILPPETKKAEFGSMPDFRDPVPETDSDEDDDDIMHCLLYTSPSPRDQRGSRMPSSA